MQRELSVIYVNYNTAGQVIDSIDSLRLNTKDVDYEIIVVDNNSQNDVDLSRLLDDSEVHVVRLDDNYGFGKANNAGFRECHGEYVLFLNPDTICKDNSIKLLLDKLKVDQNIGVLGPNMINADDAPTHAFRRTGDGIMTELNFALFGFPYKLLYGKSFEYNYTGNQLDVAYICGAAMMMKRETFEKVGGFDEDFFMYYEDQDLCNRIKQLGLRIVNEPSATIKHLEGTSCVTEKRQNLIIQSRKKYFLKTMPEWHYYIANKLTGILLFVGELLFKLFGKNEKAGAYSYRRKLIAKYE